MGYIARSLGIAFGCDTSEKLSAAQAEALLAAKLSFVVRTVPYAGQSASSGISSTELAALTSAGLGVLLYQDSRGSGWSEATGQQDGEVAAKAALALGLPNTVTLFCDLSPTDVVTSTAYVNGWCQGAVSAGWSASALGLYCEPGVPLSSQQLYELQVERYWRTAGQAPNVSSRGYSGYQLWPGDRTLSPGIVIDYDAAQIDYEGGEWVAAFAAA